MNRSLAYTFLVMMLVSVGVVAQNETVLKRKTGNEQPYYKNQWYFGLSLATSYTGFVRYGVVKIFEDGHQEVAWLTRENFIRQVTGQMESKANPERKNHMEEFQLKWDVLDQLWKIRYQEYPYETTQTVEPGWAGKMFCPSDAQWAFLKKNYGYGALTELLYGDSLWKFLKDVQDPAWASQYSSLK